LRVSQKYNLAKLHPNLAKEWHPTKNGDLKPTDVTPGTDQKVWWRCPTKKPNHEWPATVANRVKGNGCQKCYDINRGKILMESAVKRSGSLTDKHPNLAKEWHPTKNGDLKPTDVTPKSGQKVWWKCPTKKPKHEWPATVNNRANGRGCPYCAGRKVCADNNLAFKNPELAKEWHPTKNGALKPTDVTPGTHQKVWWQCEKYPEHEWPAIVYSRANGTGCRECYRLRRKGK